MVGLGDGMGEGGGGSWGIQDYEVKGLGNRGLGN